MPVKKLSKKEMKQIAERMAGPAVNWMTIEERKTYIKGVTDGLACYQREVFPAKKVHISATPESLQDCLFPYNTFRLILP